jgi:hypothetical protein
VSTLDTEGRQTFLVDPSGVLVASSSKQARLRIYGQQRMKKFGFHIIQSYSEGSDLLNYKDLLSIPLTTMSGILMAKTVPWDLDQNQMKIINKIIVTSRR